MRTNPQVTDDRSVAFVSGERHQLWWEFPLIASFQWEALVHGLRPEQWRPRVKRLAEALRIAHVLDRRVDLLTSGQRARADLALALLCRPEILRWESPFARMSEMEREWVMKLLIDLRQSEGLTAVVVDAQGLTVEVLV